MTTQTFAIACAVHARAGDIVSVFLIDEASKTRSLAASLRKTLMSGTEDDASSPLVFNETASAWFMTDTHATGVAYRGSGQAKRYTSAPNPTLPISRVIRGAVLGTSIVQDMAFNHHDTLLTIEVIEARELVAGDTLRSSHPGADSH